MFAIPAGGLAELFPNLKETMEVAEFFAVIPAAGRSHRMGDHKLLLPWQDGRVIDRVLKAWTSSLVSRTLVVIRKDDEMLHDACRSWPVTTLLLECDTPDMKASIQQGLSYVERVWGPSDMDYCLIAPADLPRLTSRVIDLVVDASKGAKQVVAPYFGDQRGHPVSIPWNMTRAIHDLKPDEGLNDLIERCDLNPVELDRRLRIRDIDTPADYEREQHDSNRLPE